ncbi:MAG TPA: PIN domain-containing protein [Anaerolineae bacterium]|nr:PIN domain-containing protein [Anaerolineae bacterium]
MRRVFFDTSAYVALTDTSDQFHADAARLAERIIAGRLPRVTTNYVLAEAYTRIRRKLGHAMAVQFGEGIRRDVVAGNLNIVYADTALDDAAWEIFTKYADREFSFVDCTSFAWLRQNPGTEVFAFDDHFLWMGFIPFRVKLTATA